METKKEKVVDALRDLIGGIYRECKGAYGPGDEGYQGQFEDEIQKVAEAICNNELP